MTHHMAPSPERATPERATPERRCRWSRWNESPGRPVRTAVNRQAEYAQRIAMILNAGVLQDAVALGLEAQGQFALDVLDVLDALESAHVKLTVDERGEAAQASAELVNTRRRQPISRAGHGGSTDPSGTTGQPQPCSVAGREDLAFVTDDGV